MKQEEFPTVDDVRVMLERMVDSLHHFGPLSTPPEEIAAEFVLKWRGMGIEALFDYVDLACLEPQPENVHFDDWDRSAMSQVFSAYFGRHPKDAIGEIGDRLYNPKYRLLILEALGGEVPGALRAVWMTHLLGQVKDFSDWEWEAIVWALLETPTLETLAVLKLLRDLHPCDGGAIDRLLSDCTGSSHTA